MNHVVLAALVAGTSVAYADPCESFVEKSKPVLDRFTKEDARRAFTPAEYQHTVARCRRDAEPPLRAQVACVLAAKDPAATRVCWENVSRLVGLTTYGHETYGVLIRAEGEFHLDRIRRNLVVAFNMMGAFPKGSGDLIPAGPSCCKRPGTLCPMIEWDDVSWAKDVDFSVSDQTLFQYSYVSDGRTATATAVGDIECDGRTETYTLKMSVKNHSPVWKMILPKQPAPKARTTSKQR